MMGKVFTKSSLGAMYAGNCNNKKEKSENY
ncbi:MAG: hypothetical protein AMQ22_00595 [Candidatus Methanofastidiosum methylothiophilum]|uniref:Uncharacterized protein n=1 Tax=Candidatus Methanofastidiosum methylothiophilum TaxID=1705564 RepID=A0A150J772_9EURY|nr:MAG: hypothetical protein AMQ22_00595 [Candidatus Methanofastidiosum methylthiophilus]